MKITKKGLGLITSKQSLPQRKTHANMSIEELKEKAYKQAGIVNKPITEQLKDMVKNII